MIFDFYFCFPFLWIEKFQTLDEVKLGTISKVSYFFIIILFSVFFFFLFISFCFFVCFFFWSHHIFLINFNFSPKSYIHIQSMFFSFRVVTSLKFLIYNISNAEVYSNSESYQTTTLGIIAKLVNDWKPLNIFEKSPILDIWQGSKYVSSIWSEFRKTVKVFLSITGKLFE